MKPNQLATLVLRLMGIYCLILLIPLTELLNNVFFYIHNSSSGPGMAAFIIALLVAVGWLAVGISLIVYFELITFHCINLICYKCTNVLYTLCY